jgi:hypothetical protein
MEVGNESHVISFASNKYFGLLTKVREFGRINNICTELEIWSTFIPSYTGLFFCGPLLEENV